MKRHLKILIAAVVVFSLAITAFVLVDFLCIEGYIASLVFCILYLGALVIYWVKSREGRGRSLLKSILGMHVLFIAFLPLGMLLKSAAYGGVRFFLSERIAQYAFLEAGTLLLLVFFDVFYVEELHIRTLSLKKSFLSPQNVTGLFRLAMLIFVDVGFLVSAETGILIYPGMVLSSIPIIIGVLILSSRQILLGYFVGLAVGVLHLFGARTFIQNGHYHPVLTVLFVLINIGMIVFNIKGGMEYNFRNNLPVTGIKRVIMKTMLTLKRAFGNPEKILEKSGVAAGMRILDYGCGVGNFSLEASKLVGSEGVVVAVDRDEKILDSLEKRIAAAGADNVVVCQASHPDSVLETGFDRILLIDVLHMIEDSGGIVMTLREKLAPGGAIVIKFEHFSEEDRENLISALGNLSVRKLMGKYWLAGEDQTKQE